MPGTIKASAAFWQSLGRRIGGEKVGGRDVRLEDVAMFRQPKIGTLGTVRRKGHLGGIELIRLEDKSDVWSLW